MGGAVGKDYKRAWETLGSDGYIHILIMVFQDYIDIKIYQRIHFKHV